MNLRIYM